MIPGRGAIAVVLALAPLVFAGFIGTPFANAQVGPLQQLQAEHIDLGFGMFIHIAQSAVPNSDGSVS